MKNIIIGISLLSVLFLVSCNGKKTNSDTIKTNDNQAVVEDTSYLDLVTIKSGDNVLVNNPRVFLEIQILFNHKRKEWVKELHSDTNINGELFLNEKRDEFYSSLGIKESDIAIYNQKHYKDIEVFLNENPEFNQAYQDSAGDQFDENY